MYGGNNNQGMGHQGQGPPGRYGQQGPGGPGMGQSGPGMGQGGPGMGQGGPGMGQGGPGMGQGGHGMGQGGPSMGPGGFAPPGGQQHRPQQQQQQNIGGMAQGDRRANANHGLQWVNASNGSIPPQAVQGGIEADGTPLFVARAMYEGGLHPGKAGPHIQNGGCSIGYGHKEVELSEYQVLCGDASKLRWINQTKELVIQGFKPVDAGHEDTGEPLYIAKTLYEGSQQLGKCAPHIKKGMSFAYGHKERTTDKYMVLAYAD
ncbi:hypothetical protein GGI07_001213 [Coemansia sp. Benny D115]|nr:hypothetical protein GGI07_001213 [Coemansia sp. Benny D115]